MQPRLVVDAVVREDYVIRYEQHDETTFVHVDVRRWTPAVAKQFRHDIDVAHQLLGRPVYALRRPEAPNQPKFLSAHGFVPCGRVFDAGGREVDIFVRILDGKSIRRGLNNHQQ